MPSTREQTSDPSQETLITPGTISERLGSAIASITGVSLFSGSLTVISGTTQLVVSGEQSSLPPQEFQASPLLLAVKRK
jgi:hypothetical protein